MIFRWVSVLLLLAMTSCKSTHTIIKSVESTHTFTTFKNLNTSDLDQKYCPDSTILEVQFLDRYLRFSGKVYDTDIQAHFENRDDLVYKESCFEFFFDPDSDSKNYYELQINAKGTIYDKTIRSPDGFASPENIVEWTIDERLVNTEVVGTLNDNKDEDLYWSFDVRIPWRLIKEGKPSIGNVWGFNFMRVDIDDNGAKHWVYKTTGRDNSVHTYEMWERLKV